MNIIVYSLPSCKICESAKAKLKMMDLEYEERNLTQALEWAPDWRSNDSEGIQAASALYQSHAPVIRINGHYYNYPEAMKLLRRK